MTTPEDAMRSVLTALGATRPVMTVRRARCGCRVGSVLWTSHGYFVFGRRSGAMTTMKADGSLGLQTAAAWYVQSLENPTGPEPWGCQHGQGILPIPALLAAVTSPQPPKRFILPEEVDGLLP